MFFNKRYRLNTCRKVLQSAVKKYKKHLLPKELQENFKFKILNLQSAIDAQDKNLADQRAKDLEAFVKIHHPTSWFVWAVEGALALGFALVVAVVVRSMWFELYEIPTGSMRPTFKEQDHLSVSKTQFGINIPLETAHFYFDPHLVQRTSAIIFSGDGLPLRDTETTFLGVFPYTKRYIKRMIALPEDTVYFYGGKLYVKDSKGNLQQDLLTSPWMTPLEHIPFINLEGQPQSIRRQTAVFSYFNMPLAKVSVDSRGGFHGEIYNGKEWVKDNLLAANVSHDTPQTLSDFFGFNNYAVGQLYTPEELKKEGLTSQGEGVLYLVLRHTPNLDFTKGSSKTTRFPKVLTAIIPLQDKDLKTLMDHLYTSRFVVRNGLARSYSHEATPANTNSVKVEGIPDGTYEFYYGKAYEVLFGGLTRELPATHPLYTLTKDRLQTWYNLGIRWDKNFKPGGFQLPARFVYFRDGNLYTMGGVLWDKESPELKQFIESEKEKQKASTASDPYIAFLDKGPPKEDKLFQAFGLHVPQKNYLVLGDNHAMSADSRIFGFVPEDNLQGVPDLLLWPLDGRLGHLAQKPYPTFVLPRLLIWLVAAIVGLVWYFIHRHRLRTRIEL